jgi:hypothetical protein
MAPAPSARLPRFQRLPGHGRPRPGRARPRRHPADRAVPPALRFAGTDDDDITNATNRTPYPTLHLIREASIDRAVQAFPEAEAIFEVNMATLEKLGPEGWARSTSGPRCAAGRLWQAPKP